MTQEILDIREQVSALVDGQADGARLNDTMRYLAADGAARADWNAYHVVGEVLRGGERATRGASASFAQGVMARLAAETIERPEVAAQPLATLRAEAANQPVFRWKVVAGLASMAAVAAIGWNLAGSVAGPSGGGQLAAVSVPGAAQGQVMIRDPRLDELMAAHQQAGGVSALQMPAGFLRNATFEGNER